MTAAPVLTAASTHAKPCFHQVTFRGYRIPAGTDTFVNTCRLLGSNLPHAGLWTANAIRISSYIHIGGTVSSTSGSALALTGASPHFACSFSHSASFGM